MFKTGSRPLALSVTGLISLLLVYSFYIYPNFNLSVSFQLRLVKINRNEKASPIEEFKLNHRKILTSLRPAKFVYVVPNLGGYGNKVIQIISAFTTALITDSAVVINMTHLSDYIEEPLFNCFQTGLNSTNELNYLFNSSQTFLLPKSTRIAWKSVKNVSDLYLKLPSNFTRFVFDSMCSLYFELACNRDYYSKFLYYGLVREATIQKATRMWNILDQLDLKHLPPKMNQLAIDVLYQTGFEVAHNIMKLFWIPKPIILNKVAQFQADHFKRYFMIGMQIRTEFIELRDVGVFIQCANQIEKQLSRPVRWYVSCDRVEMLEQLVRLFPNKIVHGEGLIAHVSADPSGYERVFLDIELLSRCDELILTGGSTFGFTSNQVHLFSIKSLLISYLYLIGSLKNGRFPMIVNGKRNTTRCERFKFSRPGGTITYMLI